MKEITKKSLGKLKIYIEPSHKVKDSEASLMGSVADYILKHAKIPVLITPKKMTD